MLTIDERHNLIRRANDVASKAHSVAAMLSRDGFENLARSEAKILRDHAAAFFDLAQQEIVD